MKSIHSYTKQSGFFTAGIGLGLLVMFGGVSFGLTPDKNEVAENPNQHQISQQAEGKTASLETVTQLVE